jgi:hypothetical protein
MTSSIRGLRSYHLVVSLQLAALLLHPNQAPAGASECLVPVPTKTPPSVFVLLYATKRPGVTNVEEYRRQQANAFRDSFAAYSALREPKVAELKVIKEQAKPADWLMEHLRIDFIDDTGIFKLYLAGGSPEEQAIILNAIVKGHDQEYERPLRKDWERSLEVYMKSLPGHIASLKSSEVMLNPDELARIPKQLNRDEYIKSIEKEIANKKNAVKKTEEGIANAERWLRVLPLVKVLEWAEVQAAK